MKKNISKKLITFSIVGGMLVSNLSVFADTLTPKPIDGETPVPILYGEEATTQEEPENLIFIKSDMYESVGDTYIVPLRQVIEGVGMEINWNQETASAEISYFNEKLTVALTGKYTTVDGKELEGYEKPTLKNDRFYVPANLLTDNLSIEMLRAGEDIYFKKDEVAKDYTGFGEILEITEGSNAILATIRNDFDFQNYTLVIGNETKISDSIGGKELKGTDLKVGDFVYAEYSQMMTRSIPPQTVASSVELVDGYAVSYGIVEKIEGEDIIIHNGNMGDIHLDLLENIVIENEAGEELSISDIKVGDRIRIYHSQIMLMMMPVTYSTVKIVK